MKKRRKLFVLMYMLFYKLSYVDSLGGYVLKRRITTFIIFTPIILPMLIISIIVLCVYSYLRSMLGYIHIYVKTAPKKYTFSQKIIITNRLMQN